MIHKAVILMTIEVHDVLPTGECSGNIVSSDVLSEYGIKPKTLLSVDGNSKEECLSKLRDKINAFRNQ